MKVVIRYVLLAGLCLALVPGARLAAQEDDLDSFCPSGDSSGEQRCRLVVQALEIAQPRLGLAFAGGNPVPGTASTLGMRVGTLPRISLGGRITGAWTEIPSVLDDDEDEIQFVIPSIDIDATVGLFSGFSPAPTLGGLLSVDLLGSVGIVPIPAGEGFESGRPLSWGAGARLGLLRESFTVPGLSISGMYRRMGNVTYGDPTLEDDPAFFTTDLTNYSARAAISKRLLMLGLTAGVGYDRYISDMSLGARGESSTLGSYVIRASQDGFENDRTMAFLNLSYSLIILHAAAEAGWQSGGDIVPNTDFAESFDPAKGAWFGSFAIRLSI